MARADWFEGLRRVPSFVGNQLGPPMLGALCGALILTILARSLTKNVEEERFGFDWTFDRCLDACFYMLVPFLIMASVGVILEQLGVRWWFLPHRPFRGTGIYLTVRLLLAFGWSFILFAIVVRGLWTGLAPEDPLGEAQ